MAKTLPCDGNSVGIRLPLSILSLVLLTFASRYTAAQEPDLIDVPWTRSDAEANPIRLPLVEPVSYFAESDGESSKPDFYVGYDQGFVIANDGKNSVTPSDFPYLMRVNSWFQLRHSLFDSDGPNADQNSFSFERLRLSFSGHVFSPDLNYFFQFDGNSDRSSQVIMLDYFAKYDLGHQLLGCEADKLGVQVGKWKVPFSRSRQETGRKLQFTDRAIANILFDLNRAIGAGMYGSIEPLQQPIQLQTAIFNGFRTGSQSTSRSDSEIDRNFGWSLRAQTDLFGDFGSDGEPDLNAHAVPALRLGSAVAYTRVDIQGTSEFSRQRVVDSGTRLSDILPADVTAYNVLLFTVDAHFKYHGFAIIGDFYWRRMSEFNGADDFHLLDHGYVLQAGYFVCPEKLELLGRWSAIVGDSGTLGGENRSSDEVAVGLAWYFRGHNAKLTFDATYIDSAPVSSSRLDLLPADVGLLYRTQLQIAF